MNNDNLNNQETNEMLIPETLDTITNNNNNNASELLDVNASQNVENLGSDFNMNQGPVAQPIPGTENMMDAPNNKNINANIVTPKAENIGTIPPSNNINSGNKKSNNIILFIVLIIILIFAVAGGVYYFLFMSKTTYEVILKQVTVNIGDSLSDNLDDYAIITKGDKTNCKQVISNVDINTIGTYDNSFSIKCGEKVFDGGKIIVRDGTAPSVSYNILFKPVGSSVSVNDFINSCIDDSECNDPQITNESQLNDYLSTVGGPNNIPIKVSDKVGNEKTINAILYTTEYNVIAYTNCSSKEENVDSYQATKVITDIFPVGNSADATLIYLGYGRRNYKYTFSNVNDYQIVIGNKLENITFDNVTGLASYNDEELSLTISTDLSINTLKSENNGEFDINYANFFTKYTTEKEYTCANIVELTPINN